MKTNLQMNIIGLYSTRFTDINKAFLYFFSQHNINQSATVKFLNKKMVE